MWDSWRMVHRETILRALGHIGTVGGVYEVGAGSGPNLRLIRENFPQVHLAGSEPYGPMRQWVREHLGIRLDTTRLPGTGCQTADVVISCYTLAYVHPEVLSEFLEMLPARRLILAEPTAGIPPHEGAGIKMPDGEKAMGYAVHDYRSALGEAGWRLTGLWTDNNANNLNAVMTAERV